MEGSGLRLRESFRVAVTGRARLLVGAASTTVDATALDLSTTGMGLATAVATPKPPVGEVCAFELQIAGARIEGRGVVVWSRRARPDRGDAPNVGIRFERLEGIAQREIDGLVQKRLVTGRWPTPASTASLLVAGRHAVAATEEQLTFAVGSTVVPQPQQLPQPLSPILAATEAATVEPVPPTSAPAPPPSPAAPTAAYPRTVEAAEAPKRRGLLGLAIAAALLVVAIVAWRFVARDEGAPSDGGDEVAANASAGADETSLDSVSVGESESAVESVPVPASNDTTIVDADNSSRPATARADAESVEVAEADARPAAVSDAPAPVDSPRARRLAKVETSAEGATEIIALRFDAPFREADLFAALIGPDPPRYLLRLRGIEQVWRPRDLEVGSPLVERVRTGLHSTPRGPELHIVIDLNTRAVEHSWAIEGDALRVRLTPRAP